MFIQILMYMNLPADRGAMKFMVIDILYFSFLHAVGQLQWKRVQIRCCENLFTRATNT